MNYTLFLLSVCAFGLLIFLYPIYINWLKKKTVWTVYQTRRPGPS